MNHTELTRALSAASKLTQKDVEAVLSALATVVTAQVQSGSEVALHGIGKIKARHKAARTSRNPKTGAAVAVPAKLTAVFSASKSLKDALALNP
ncbi:MAG: hypothetical protein COW02_03490 [Comamonadaceae bacterium CG12_big_fil_rev_8_21_14_0_65_59_15]|nr:MAG: hypothetical protein COW02_03490 [Comamonadaceae bacterium CG12_big_fil_rev_8_21_14_0_65_59_15]